MLDPKPFSRRREFLKLSAASALGGLLPARVRAAGISTDAAALYAQVIPAKKKLDAKWAASLIRRDHALDAAIATSKKEDLPRIGMTVGGIGCGTVYLSGDGRLYVWDIFHQPHEGVVAATAEVPAGFENIAQGGKKVRERDGANYVVPPTPDQHPGSFRQGFSIQLDDATPRPFDGKAWEKVSFTGEWPAGRVAYRDKDCPLEVDLLSWTPFVPLSLDDSTWPVTVMEFTVRNRSDKPARGNLIGHLENPVLSVKGRGSEIQLESVKAIGDGLALLSHAAQRKNETTAARPDILFADFEEADYGKWKSEGTAFGIGPVARADVPDYQGRLGAHGGKSINSHASAPGDSVAAKDAATGSLLSPEFTIERKFIRLLLGGGSQSGKTGIEVLIGDKVIASATGPDSNTMRPVVLDVFAHEGKVARLRLIDRATGAWGNTGSDHIVFTDQSSSPDAEKRGDFGTMVLAALDGSAVVKAETMGSVALAFDLAPGEVKTFSYFFAWHFPNGGKLQGPGDYRPRYTVRHGNATEVARAFAKDFARLRDLTMRWVKTWKDSTLPRWLLDRAILTTNTLQTTNCHFLENGRFWAWEGVGCCPGTCAHVWHYAQGVARLFPEIERNLREVTDFGVAIKDDGSIPFRAEATKTIAIDAQTSTLLRTWREHLVSKDDAFLRRVWPDAKRALEWLIRFDANGRGGLDGLLDGEQHNTLDAEWYGKVHCLCSLYLASLAAGEKIALTMGDETFAKECARLLASGAEGMKKLFNGEFYIQEEDPAHSKAIGVGTGCYIDQVIGQWWAHVVGLGRIYDEANIRSALHALWRYNFSPEVGAFRKVFTRGRFYALPGEAGLLMCTWPKGGLREDFTKHWQYAYFNECMTGFEWQAAAHMIQEGETLGANDAEQLTNLIDGPNDGRALTARGLAVARAIHDRYAPSRRNPYNEIECSDHYARANASYSVFLAACGFIYDGPDGRIGFAPKIQPENFRTPFTAADGWGTFSQKRNESGKWSASLELTHGRLMLRQLELPWLADGAIIKSGDRILPGQVSQVRWTAKDPVVLVAGEGGLVIEG